MCKVFSIQSNMMNVPVSNIKLDTNATHQHFTNIFNHHMNSMATIYMNLKGFLISLWKTGFLNNFSEL